MATWHYTNSRGTVVLVSFNGRVGGSGALVQPGQRLVFNAADWHHMIVLRPEDLWGRQFERALTERALSTSGEQPTEFAR
jgi:hypothetical protein